MLKLCIACGITPKVLNERPINKKSIRTKIINNTLCVSIAPIVIKIVKIKYPIKATPSCFESAACANFSPNTKLN